MYNPEMCVKENGTQAVSNSCRSNSNSEDVGMKHHLPVHHKNIRVTRGTLWSTMEGDTFRY
jgi:hypothetical protein